MLIYITNLSIVNRTGSGCSGDVFGKKVHNFSHGCERWLSLWQSQTSRLAIRTVTSWCLYASTFFQRKGQTIFHKMWTRVSHNRCTQILLRYASLSEMRFTISISFLFAQLFLHITFTKDMWRVVGAEMVFITSVRLSILWQSFV